MNKGGYAEKAGVGWTRRRFLGMCGAGVLAGSGIYACAVEPTWLRVVRLELGLRDLPAEFDGYRIAQVSDLHVGGGVGPAFLNEAVATANGFRPDLAVVTGDLVDACGSGEARAAAAAILSGLESVDGAFAVLGNHDTGSLHPGDPVDHDAVRDLKGALAEARVRLLVNDAVRLERKGARIRLSGCGDLWSGQFEPAALPLGDGIDLVLSHNPDTAPELAARGADVVLCGHTHGGQIRLPFYGPPWIPLQNKEFVAGHFEVERTHLYVNSGLGYTFGIRFRARPEVTLLTLRAA